METEEHYPTGEWIQLKPRRKGLEGRKVFEVGCTCGKMKKRKLDNQEEGLRWYYKHHAIPGQIGWNIGA